MEVEFKINDSMHREAVINALAHAGYKVWVEVKHTKCYFGDNYYVCAEIPEKEVSFNGDNQINNDNNTDE